MIETVGIQFEDDRENTASLTNVVGRSGYPSAKN
jgi:hypothetical protein